MSTKWFIFLISSWMIGTILGGMIEGTYLGEAEAADLQAVTGMTMYKLGPISVPVPSGGDWLDALWNMMSWNFSFFTDEWEIIKWIIYLPIAGGLVISLIMVVMPWLISIFGSIFGFITGR